MKVIKKINEFGLNIFFEEEEKHIAFTMGGNGDLYWSFHSTADVKNDDENYGYFIITKENYGVYSLFERLFFDIENINIFDEETIPFYIESEIEKQEYLKSRKKENEKTKKAYRLYNRSNYNELFDDASKTITWYSDEVAHAVANILKIKKLDKVFLIEFYIQPNMEGYDEDFHSLGYIPIRFRNSGSSYYPFNVIFMEMYNGMKEIDDVNDIGHQIHFEEIEYARKLSKSK